MLVGDARQQAVDAPSGGRSETVADRGVVDDLRSEVANLAKILSSVVNLASAVMRVLGGGLGGSPPYHSFED